MAVGDYYFKRGEGMPRAYGAGTTLMNKKQGDDLD